MTKIFRIIPVIIVFSLCNCKESAKHSTEVNKLSISKDTLVVTGTKQKGSGLFPFAAMPVSFDKISRSTADSLNVPHTITDVKRFKWGVDSANNQFYIDIVIGKNNKENICIVDENNNKSFADDSIRKIKPMDWYTSNDLITCNYTTIKDGKKIKNTSWLKVGLSNGSIYIGKSQHVTANVTLKDTTYTIAVICLFRGDMVFDTLHSQLAVVSQNNVKKDTLLEKDIIKHKEFLKLGDAYYKYHDISKDGRKLTLIKEKGFNNLTGTQVGMKAPNFQCKTVSGQMIRSSELVNKPIIIANACGCGGDKESTQATQDIYNAYKDKAYILSLDSKINKELSGLLIDMEDEGNKAIYNTYRGKYCSRICYVIKNDRIIDKFPVTSWGKHIPTILN